jgi:starch synthase
MIILTHPTGNANVRQAARALNEGGLLAEFWTSVCWPGEHPLNHVLSPSMRNELRRRFFPEVHEDQRHSHLWPEMARLLTGRLGLKRLTKHEVGPFCIDAVYRSVDRKVAARLRKSPVAQGVFAYEDGALETFRTARRLGIKTIYELPIGYWKSYRELMKEEAAREPEWASTLPGNTDSPEKLKRKDDELELADQIIVPSEFVRGTLSKNDSLTAPIHVVPYGAPAVTSIERGMRPPGSKLRIIFVGALTQRKGLAYLLRAVERLNSSVELTIVGKRVGECRELDRALSIHRWIPSLPHNSVLQEISRHDVMVFPTLFEGFGLVVLEAMSVGVPVITTPNSGATECISDGKDGFLVPIRDVDAIVQRLELLFQGQERLPAMADAARSRAVKHCWERYRQQLTRVALQVLADGAPASSSPSSYLNTIDACHLC